MTKSKKEVVAEVKEEVGQINNVSIHDLEWTDYVLSKLSDDEKIAGNPTTDGLRRIFEKVLNCRVVASQSRVVQSPDPNNEKRATVVHTLCYHLNDSTPETSHLNMITVDGAADVYWGNCDKIYRNHPVAVAETRAEGRALRRALRLRKVVAAEEISKDIDDHPDQSTVSKITPNQINFIDVVSQRLNINVVELFKHNSINTANIFNTLHEDAVSIIRILSKYQQNIADIPPTIIGYSPEWK
jgi:hypothetical protein